ncbi:MAG: carbohydrate ABC transporter permease [bacterium]
MAERRLRYRQAGKTVAPYLFISSPMLSIIALIAFPVLYALYVSLCDWHFMATQRPFVGLKNYSAVLKDPLFHTVLWNTTYFTIVYVSLSTLIGLSLALIINNLKVKLRTLMRAVIFIPVITSMVAVALVWVWIYDPSFGLLNYILRSIGLRPRRWLVDPKLAMNSVIMMTIWKNVGMTTVIFMAGLVDIPREYYEAAMTDGASGWQMIRHITLPLLKNVTAFIIITGVIGAFQVFTQTFVMTGGGPGTATRTIVLEIYLRGFRYLRMGEASAMAFILFGIIFIVTLIQLRYFRAEIVY